MLGTYYYHEIIRKTIISFGTLFNQIHLRHTDKDNNNISDIRVPITYGPKQKFLARILQQPELNKATQISLPRMTFEMNSIQYDSTRKSNIVQTFRTTDEGDNIKKVFMPVPYNIGFELNILCKLNDDALQIIEQILPYFQPAFNVTVDLVESKQEKRDITIILENITIQDDYEGDFTTRRVLLYTLRFTAKTYLFGPVSSTTKDIIKSAKISYLTGTDITNTTREIVYNVTPRATKNYTGEVATTLSTDITKTSKVIEVDDASGLSEQTYVDIEGEELYIKSISGNKVTVLRGQDGTTITDHLRGAPIHIINAADNALVEEGDDFGFSGSVL